MDTPSTPTHSTNEYGIASSSKLPEQTLPSPSSPSQGTDDAQSITSVSTRSWGTTSLSSRASTYRRRPKKHYDSDQYVHDHLNDPNYTYRGSADDLQQDTADISGSGAEFSIELDDKSYQGDKSWPDIDGEDAYWEDDSPYPEVRAAVANADDPTMPVNTFRMWALGIFFCIFIAGMNQFFSLRYPSVSITALVAQLIALPFGKLLERLLPSRPITLRLPFTDLSYTFTLNPGPWNIKEHTLVTVMANVVSGGAYATDIIATQRTFYDQHWGISYQLCLVISTQLIGFSLAGICRRFLVWPAAMIWPATLVNAALFNTLHSSYVDDQTAEMYEQEEAEAEEQEGKQEDESTPQSPTQSRLSRLWPFSRRTTMAKRRKTNPRFAFFIRAFIVSTIWEFFPGYLFTALSQFTPLCWIFTTPNNVLAYMNSNPSPEPFPLTNPPTSITTSSLPTTTSLPLLRKRQQSGIPTTPRKNIIINQLFGYQTGLGMGFLTFDWAMIAYTGSPLVTPWWAEVNVFVTLVVVFWIITPALYYKNVFFSQYLPMSSSNSFDNLGNVYDVSRVVVDGVFQEDLYKAYSPLYMPATFAISYGLSFGALTATVVHTFLWYRNDIKRQLHGSLKDSSQEDVHARLMLAYPEVPQWWYALIGVAALCLGAITIEIWDTKLPFWAYVVSLVIALVYLVPVGMIQAITNMQVGLNVITELIVGYALPGRPVAMMIFKTFGYITMTQALSFVSDLKLGHYMKIPPRMMFVTQTVAALIACFVVVGVQDWMFGNIPGLCENDQPDRFTCPGVRVFSSASLIWGGIGPVRAFNHGSLYYPTLFFFVIGAALPIPFYFLARIFPRGWYKYVNIPVAFTGIGNLPPATGINFSSWALVGFIFQYYIRRRRFRWWSQYNYILSAALDAGVAVGTVLVFFTLAYPKTDGIIVSWRGNTVNNNTPDTLGTPLKVPPPGEFFGLKEWN